MKAEIVRKNGTVYIRINGKEHAFAATRSFRPEGRILKKFSDSGIGFFNVFPSGIMTALENRTVPYSKFGPVWVGDHEYNWDNLRAQCDEFFLSISPDTYVSLSVHLDPPTWYVKSHPELVDHWEQMIQNLGSEEWKRDAVDYMCALIDKIDEWYPERVFAVHLMSGGTTEWYSYLADKVIEEPTELARDTYRRMTGLEMPTAQRIRMGYDGVLRHPREMSDVIEYTKFVNNTVADTVLYFARAAKVHTKGEKLVGLFFGHLYGTQLDLAVRMGYNEFDRLLESADIDMIFCPASYISRKLESTSGIRVPVDSLRDHGKLFVHEIDSATHLVRNNKNAERAAVSHAGGRDEEFSCTEDSIMYIRREVGMILSKGEGYWWFDMFSGYYDDPQLMDEIKRLHKIQEKLLCLDNSSISEVCEFVDPHSNYMLATGCHYPMVEHQSSIFSRTGATWDMRMTSDLFDGNIDTDRYKLYIFPALFAPDERMREKIRELREKGKNILFMHAPGYITDDGFSEDAMEKLTGIRLEKVKLRDNTVCGVDKLDKVSYDFTNAPAVGEVTVTETVPRNVYNIEPIFAAQGLDTVLGRFKENGKPACGIKYRSDGSFDAFSACAPMPIEFIREIWRLSGIFIHADGDAVVYASKSFKCIYSYDGGDITLYHPEDAVFCDCFDGSKLRVGRGGCRVSFKPHETKFFCITKDLKG